jgi:DNA-binding transcriptional ArsR family regulator
MCFPSKLKPTAFSVQYGLRPHKNTANKKVYARARVHDDERLSSSARIYIRNDIVIKQELHCCLSGRKSKTTNESIEDTKQYHERYLLAINNPLRRKILRALNEGDATIEDLESRTRLDKENLTWHLSILEHGFCVEKHNKQGKVIYKLTQEGRVVDYME